MPKLVYHDSDGVDRVINLGSEPVLIGRATECQVQTQDAMVSRRHARIIWDGNYWIEDLGSSNGVYVGTEKVQRAPFRPGDTVSCGSLVLRMLPDASPRGIEGEVARVDPVAMTQPPPLPVAQAAFAQPAPKRMAETEPVAVEEAPAVAQTPDRSDERVPPREQRGVIEERAPAREQRGVIEERAPAREQRGVIEERAAVREQRGVIEERAPVREQRGAVEERASGGRELEQLRQAVRELSEERTQLQAELERAKSSSVPPRLADGVVLLGDSLAALRASLRNANGEATLLKEPEEAAQGVREALKAAAEQLEAARAQLRGLAKLLGL